ncbi:hypothetical protein G9A89_019596 [Geosiphon pyriformis]|nr:hypothetical protein G9A89_019596 [Geosiphon pyriformis]
MSANATMFLDEFAVTTGFSDLDAMWDIVCKIIVLLANKSALSKVKKIYCSLKLAELRHGKESQIKLAINKKMESFELNKDYTIQSVLECPFCKVILDHLVVNDELILEPGCFGKGSGALAGVIEHAEDCQSKSKIALLISFVNSNGVLGQLFSHRSHDFNNKFKVATTPDTATLEYYQSIYTHCKQRFNIPDGIEVVKKSVYQYIENHINNYFFRNYNISEVRSNLYNNLVHYSQLRTEDLNSKTLATYFQKLNFNIIEYCEEKYSVQAQYSIDFESETKTSNKGKQRLKQYSRTTPNTPILPKTTAKHLQTPEQRTSVKLPLSITPFPISLLPRNPTQQQKPISTSANIIDYLQKNESNHLESSESEKTESKPEEITENEEEMATAYIAKIPEFPAELKDKLIKKVCPHALADLATAIRHAKSYEMAIEEANHTKLVNLAIGENNSAAKEKIDQLTKKQRPNHYYTQSSYLIIPEESDFQPPALSEGEVAAPRSNSSNNTIPPAQIAQNANLSDIFPFEFETNKSLFLFSNAAANEQKAITAMYTEATLMQQLQRTVDRPAQTVIVTADGMKKTPVGEIDNFPFTINRITIPVKVLVMNAPQYQALVGNDWLLKANANLDWETQELKISYQGQYTIIPATYEKAPVFEFEEEKKMPLTETYMALGLTSNWKKVRYSTPELQKESPYIPLKCKDCKKKLSSMGACISLEEEYETHTCYFCKACHREQFGSPKRSGKWDNTPCFICGDMLPEECNWIDVAIRGGVCDQTCQYALSISKKVRRETLFNAVYNSALNKLYHHPHDAKMIFDLAIALINRATQEDLHQMKEAKYIKYTMELAGFDYEDEVETYHQITSHTYPTKEAQIQ